MTNYRIKTSFVVEPEVRFFLIFVENRLQYYARNDFSVALRTGSNPADINRNLRHTGNNFNHTLEMLENVRSASWLKHFQVYLIVCFSIPSI